MDLLAENMDLAIRAGVLKDSSLVAKKLGEVFFAPFVSPKYLKEFGAPESPRQLSKHRCIHFTPLGAESWRLVSSQETIDVKISGSLLVNDLQVVRTLVSEGLGVALLPNYFCKKEVSEGKLIRLLPKWKASQVPVHFIYPGQKFATPKLTQFIKLCSEQIASKLK